VIGSGASSIQTVPGMQPHVKHMDVFVRTVREPLCRCCILDTNTLDPQGVWFTTIAGNEGLNKAYSDEEKAKFRSDPDALVEHSKFIENQINGGWGTFYSGSEHQKMAQQMFKARMAEWIKDERLLQGTHSKMSIPVLQ
jgi:hypothetical protein